MIVKMSKKAKLSILYARQQFPVANNWEENIVCSQSFRDGYSSALTLLKEVIKDPSSFNFEVEFDFTNTSHQLWGTRNRNE